jgi:hypothetical protein
VRQQKNMDSCSCMIQLFNFSIRSMNFRPWRCARRYQRTESTRNEKCDNRRGIKNKTQRCPSEKMLHFSAALILLLQFSEPFIGSKSHENDAAIQSFALTAPYMYPHAAQLQHSRRLFPCRMMMTDAGRKICRNHDSYGSTTVKILRCLGL